MKKEPKKRILYSNSYDYLYEDAQAFLIENHRENNPQDFEWKPSDERIVEEMSSIDDLNWDDFKINFENFFNTNTFVLQGTVGRWDGTYGAGYVFDSFHGLCRAWQSCEYVEIYDCNGHLYVDCSHHDGSNHYEIRVLTECGVKYVDNHKYDMDERELHTKLMHPNHSKLPHAAHTVFGCKRIEYEKGE